MHAMKTMSVNSPNELLQAITLLFPDYTFEQGENDPHEFTYWALLQDFIVFYGANNSKFTERQISGLATLINRAVEGGGDLENAFATCFLEHLGQIKAIKPLSAFLSHAAKERLHA